MTHLPARRHGALFGRTYALLLSVLVAAISQPLRALPPSRSVANVYPTIESIVHGTVTDSAGKPLGNVQVVISTLNRVAITDDRGEFVLRGLPAGQYHLNLVRIGYRAEHELITVPASGADVRVKIVMQIATVRLSSVNVTATPNGADPLEVTQATVQLGGKELQRALSSSIGQTLANEPGMSSRFNGPMANAPVIRGLTGERVLVLQDGDRTGDLSSAAADHLNAVDPSSAERIEVIRGPASLLYGNNALGGVVNVITSDIPSSIPSRVSGYALGQGESASPGGVGALGITVPVGAHFALTGRGGLRSFSDLRVGGGAQQDNTNGNTNNATIGGGYVGDHASIGLVYRQMDFRYGLPHAADEEAVRLDGQRRMMQLQSTFGTHFEPIASIKADGSAVWYQHSEIEPSGAVGTKFALNTQTANVTARTKFGSANGTIGFQGLFRQYTPTGDEAFTPGSDNNNVAVFAFQEIPLAHGLAEERTPSLQLGARYDRFALTTSPTTVDELARFGSAVSKHFDNLAASIGVSVPVSTNVSVTGNASRGFRAPTVEEMFANGFHAAAGTFDIGNALLTPEQSVGLEAGVRAQTASTFAQFNTYYNRINDYIRPVAVATREVDGNAVPLVNYQQADASLYGVEGQVETKLPHQLVGGLMGDVTHAALRDGSANLPFIPAARLGGSLRFDNGHWSAGGDMRRVFSQTRVSGDALDVPTDAYTLVNVSASWLVTAAGSSVHSITLRADNVFDAQYRDATSRIKRFAYNPGRNLSVIYKLLY